MQDKNKFFRQLGLVLSTAMLTMLSACNFLDSSDLNNDGNFQRVPSAALTLIQPQSCSTYKEYITSSLVKRYTTIPRYNYYGCVKGGVVGDITAGGPPPTAETSADGSLAGAAPATQKGPDDVSQTNNQVAGVNESDMVKTDSATGTVFIGHSKYLLIADAFPPQNMSLVKQIDMKAEVIDLLYDQTNHHLTVVTRYNSPIIYFDNGGLLSGAQVVAIDGIAAPIQNFSKPETVVTFFDVSNTLAPGAANNPTVAPADPVLLEQISIDGNYQTSRRIDNRVHMVTRHNLSPEVLTSDAEFNQLNYAFYDAIHVASCDSSGSTVDLDTIENDPGVIAAKQNLTARITNVVAKLDASTFLPHATKNTTAGKTDIADFVQCNDIYHPGVKSELGMQVVTSVDTDGSNIGASGIMNNSGLTYVSKKSLYISEISSHWWWGQGDFMDQTAIHKFTISDQRPVYRATGNIDGHANNSFNFSEHNDVLRVATTQTNISPPTSETPRLRELKNHLHVLVDDNAGNLNIIGSVRNLAIGESIRSVRFMAERGFMVTFRNIDPLFTFDLSDPSNPQLKGELKIPGFSTYMHPYDDTHLLTIGRDGGQNGLGTGTDLQLQLIDVSDMSNPVVVARSGTNQTLPSGYSWSAAAYDHHAFTFYKPANLLIIPMQIYAYDPTLSFSGMMAFKVSLGDGANPASITEIGRVDHSDLANKYYCSTNTLAPQYDWACLDSSYIYWATPRRSIIMTESSNIYLYTLSDMGMKAGLIGDSYSPISDLVFPAQIYPWNSIGVADSATGTGELFIR